MERPVGVFGGLLGLCCPSLRSTQVTRQILSDVMALRASATGYLTRTHTRMRTHVQVVILEDMRTLSERQIHTVGMPMQVSRADRMLAMPCRKGTIQPWGRRRPDPFAGGGKWNHDMFEQLQEEGNVGTAVPPAAAPP